MATVHLGRAVGVGGFERLVAIKVMHPQFAAEPEFVTMFLDEARLAARIRHPNVVPTLDVQESADGLFLVMEYIDGPSLQQLRKAVGTKPGAIPLPIVLRIMIETLNGLHCAHELRDDEDQPLNLIHRDVSPVNVLVGSDGGARITDFGVARAEARLSSTRGGQLKGKIPFMPPEQLLNEELDRRCDVYAAGAVLWESIVGKRLFHADSDGALLTMILSGASSKPSEHDPSVPPAIDEVVMKALAKKREQRFASAADFAEALEHAAAESKIAVASSRAVATFIAEAGAHKKLDLKELATLRRGLPTRDPVPSSPGDPTPAAREISRPSAPSQVTAGDVAMSAAPVTLKAQRSALPFVVGGVGLAAVIAAVAFFGSRKDAPASPASPASEAPVVTASAKPSPIEVLPSTSSAVVTASASSAASARNTASAGVAPGSKSSPQSLPATPAAATPASKTATPSKTAYNPDRL
jgi:serine/threonine-protein kinase